MDAVYVVDQLADSYTVIKDNEFFHKEFGNNGVYNNMLQSLFENTLDSEVIKSSPYSVFLDRYEKFSNVISNSARFRFGDREMTISLWSVPLEEGRFALVIKEQGEQEYIKKTYNNQQMNAIKSAYLFSMIVDLNTDKCDSINMSEIENVPVNQQDVSYSIWRSTIINMFLPEDHKMFLEITDSDYLRKNLKYHASKSVDCKMMNLDGDYIWVKLIFSRINTGNDDDFSFIFMVENIHESHTRLINDLKKFENLANRDSLTGLLNHGSIEREINKSICDTKENQKKVSLIMFDVDHFKNINDTYGHAVGDYVLRTLSSIAQMYIEMYDGKIGRWGGEEFIGVCENISLNEMQDIAEQLRTKVENYEFENVSKLTCSFGVVEVEADEATEMAFDRIDAALYKAKNTGRNRVVVG